MRMTSENIKNYSTIRCRDYSDYDPARCNNGGAYATGVTLYNNDDGTFTSVPYTSGEYCPKCGSWDCGGGCSEDDRISAIEALFTINSYSKDDDCEVMFDL